MSRFIKIGANIYLRSSIVHCAKHDKPASKGILGIVTDARWELKLTYYKFELRGGPTAEYYYKTQTLHFADCEYRDACYERISTIVKINTEEL